MKKLDDIQLRNKKKSDTLFYHRDDFFRKKPPIEKTLYVTKVTNEYIYARGSNDKNSWNYRENYKFTIDNGHEVTERASSGYCYSSKEFYDEMVEFDTKRYSMIDCINEMHTKSDKRLVNTMYELMNNWEE